MRRDHWIGLAAGVVVAWWAATIPARAQAPGSSPGGEVVRLRREVSELTLEMLRAEATAAELEDEERLLAPALQRSGEADARPLSAEKELWDETIRKRIGAAEVAQTPTAQEELVKVRNAIAKDETEAVAAWKAAMEKDLAFQDEIDKAERLVGWPWKGKKPGVDVSLGLIAQGILAVLGGLLLTVHELRGRLRWRLRAVGSRPGAIGVALLLPLAAAFEGSPSPGDEPEKPPAVVNLAVEAGRDSRALEQRREELIQKLGEKKEANDAAARQLALHLEEVRRARAANALRAENRDQKELVDRAEAIEAGIQEQFQKVRVMARIASRAIADAGRLEGQLKDDHQGLDVFVMFSRGTVSSNSLVRLAACGFFILAAFVPLLRVRRRRRAQLNEESRKCPRCLNLDTLDFDTASSEDDGGPRVKFRKKVCNVCDYEIRENYIRQNRLCFPTVGIRASGKTHWMMMLYDMIKNSNIPVASAIRKIPSREDARFDDLVRRLLYEGGRLDPTVYSLPYPLTFHVHDADPLGPNQSMVNLFDFSGEMRNFDIDQNEFRRRALLCDGFTLFLDPTQVSKGSDATIEDQIQTLAQFAEEMHAIRGLSSENPIDLPIAICVSKMDLLVNKSLIGTQAIDLVTDLRRSVTRRVDLALIHERSRLCAGAMPLMFPGWNVGRMLRENFGGRYMFFPMSSVGLEGEELGIEDLSQRTIAPFGTIEPLLWLLHMHGYCVLHRR